MADISMLLMALMFAATSATTIREVRSPDGNGWQGSGHFGRAFPSSDAPDSSGSWAGTGNILSYEDEYGSNSAAWNGKYDYDATSRSNGEQNGYPSASVWAKSSNGGYARYADAQDSVPSGRQSNFRHTSAWNKPRFNFRSNNNNYGWRSSSW